MKFEDSIYYKSLNPPKLEFPFGNYYLLEKFVVAELFEGVHFDWEKTKLLIGRIVDFYGENPKIGFISNRINHYSIDPQNWLKWEKEYGFVVASAIVIYNSSNLMNASIEKKFANRRIKSCQSITEAIDWMLNLEELS
ncbi:hypothetical protein [Litoribaculum gwangyangense]|uniref:STAS/SEC14 domain-containing protein n=1 Tax=Litoribaculum gwangyangense TaxID=1130722 RepID=A0ABP9CGF9_9FLAO